MWEDGERRWAGPGAEMKSKSTHDSLGKRIKIGPSLTGTLSPPPPPRLRAIPIRSCQRRRDAMVASHVTARWFDPNNLANITCHKAQHCEHRRLPLERHWTTGRNVVAMPLEFHSHPGRIPQTLRPRIPSCDERPPPTKKTPWRKLMDTSLGIGCRPPGLGRRA